MKFIKIINTITIKLTLKSKQIRFKNTKKFSMSFTLSFSMNVETNDNHYTMPFVLLVHL